MSTRGLFLSCLFVAVAVASRPAVAENPNQAFNGKIIVSAKRFPTTAKSPTAYTQAIRKLSQSNFMEDKTDHSWVLNFAGFLKAPLNDMEYVLKVYELVGRTQQLLVTADQYTDERGQRTILSKIKLDKKSIGVNKVVMLTIENRGKVLASSGPIKILGEGERFSGKVNFSDDEAAGKEKDDDDGAKKK